MSLQYFSHRHPLILIRKKVHHTDDKGDEMFCYACHQPILPPSLAAAAASEDDDVYICGEDDNCDDAFYLHKKCVESPKEIQHPMHDPHPLTLQSRPDYFNNAYSCNACGLVWKWFTYNCDSCQFDVCIRCAVVGDRSFRHVGHGQHTLSLMQREALFKCYACGTEAKDSSYACNSCEFWMHKTCAWSPTIFEAGNILHLSLVLIYSLPNIHRTFTEYCTICKGRVRFPVDSKESFIHLMIDQFFTKWYLEKDNINLEKPHEDHPLELLEELVGSEQVEEIICNGCIQPITPATTHPFYGCIRCNFFLHKFCLQLPPELPAGASSRHPQHPLLLYKRKNMFFGVTCTPCQLATNGFYYWCKTCDIRFDIRCSFLLPNRIKHQSHNHPLFHSSPSHSACHACGYLYTDDELFKCQRMSCDFQIHQRCALLPDFIKDGPSRPYLLRDL